MFVKRIAIYSIKWILPVIFIAYYSSISFYAHIHIENGTAILHSHPFARSSDKIPHTHNTFEEIIILHNLSSLQIADDITNRVCLEYLPDISICIFTSLTPSILTSLEGNLFLRAPPFA